MSPERQRIAIAEFCGWVNRSSYDRNPNTQWKPPGKDTQCVPHPPDYLSDLNAMHEAEKVLDDIHGPGGSLRWDYADRLYSICRSWQQPCRATAAQRAEAFLKTIGKWVEK